MIQTIIGLNGRLHSGKDTAFEAIRAHYAETGLVAARIAFADRLKLSAALALGFNPASVAEAVAICNDLKEGGTVRVTLGDDPDGDCHHISGREYLQRYGTEAHRDVFGADFWVEATIPEHFVTLDDIYPNVDVLVVTDVRFPNEAARILDHSGHVWWINADERLGALPEDAHPSEHPLEPHLLSDVVNNDGTLADYTAALSTALETL